MDNIPLSFTDNNCLKRIDQKSCNLL